MKDRPVSVLQNDRADRMVRAYLALFAASFVLTVIGMLLTGGRSFTDTLFYNYLGKGDTFMDFYNSIRDAGTKEVYKNGIIYPPLANLFFYLLSRLIDPRLVALPYEERFQLQSDTTCRVILFIFTFVCLAWILFLAIQKTKGRFFIGTAVGLSLVFLLSYPMIYCVQRGNLILLSMALSMFFVFYRNDDRKWVRELCLLALAVAAGLKLYPAVLGLLLVRDKEYKRALRLIAYGLIFIVLPFFFYDGWESMKELAGNLREFSDARNISPAYATTDVFAVYANMMLHVDFNVMHWVLFVPAMAAAAVSFCLTDRAWVRVFCLCYLFMNLNSSGQSYVLIFLLIPFVLFLIKPDFEKTDWLYYAMFSILLICIPVLYYRLINPDGAVLLETRKYLIRPNQLLAAPALQGLLLALTIETTVMRIKKIRA